MNRKDRLDVVRNRAKAMEQLSAMVLEEVPAAIPEIQQLRLRLSQSRALVLAMEVVLQSLYERDIPRSERTIDPNAYIVHRESTMLVTSALTLIQRAKEIL